ncbi:MAG TPA: two-component regulator propeller domain-containing protein [Gemmatimonadales bacterium]|nr:two-component regulator propeller domain-containing protein [Gemmatimonadales bacterium]
MLTAAPLPFCPSAAAQLPEPFPLASGRPGAPRYVADPSWPRPLPGKWILGQVSGIWVDRRDHVWVLHRPRTLTEREVGAVQQPALSECCTPAPAVLELDPDGNVVRAWGGPGHGAFWPSSEHTIYVDHQGNVWIGSNGRNDQVVQKYTPDGMLLLQLGRPGQTGGSNDTLLLGQPAGIVVDSADNEVYVADGYGNRRVIVFDAITGRYRRHWGAYGARPSDEDLGPYDPSAPPARQFRSPVHGVRIDRDGLVYVADRVNDRIQVFRKSGEFVKEVSLAPATRAMGSVWDLTLSTDPAQRYLFVPDGTNQKVWVLARATLAPVAEFGRGGRAPGHFGWVHNLAVDSRGNVYTSEVDIYKRIQKFRPDGVFR